MKQLNNPLGILLLACMFPWFTTLGQNPEWKFIRPTNTGVCGDYHQAIAVDRLGRIWTTGYMPFWSEGGVTMFDGTVWTTWSNFDSPLPNERVNDIQFDQFNNVWIATENGLAKFDGTNWTIYNSSNAGFTSNNIRGVVIDLSGNVWVTFQGVSNSNGGVGKYNGSTWTIYTASNSNLPTNKVGSAAVDQQNNVWFGSVIGAIKFDGLNWIVYNTNNSGIPSNEVEDVFVDELNNKWFVTTRGAARYNGSSWLVYNSQNTPMPDDRYLSSITIRGNDIWISAIDYFIAHFDGSQWTIFPTDNFTFDVAIDSSGNGWACGIGFVEKYNGSNWTVYTRFNTGLPGHFVDEIYIDKNNIKWIASGDNGGIAKFDGNTWTDYGLRNGNHHPWPFPYTTIGTSSVMDRVGNNWIAARGVLGGVAKWENDHWVTWDNANSGVVLQDIAAIAADSLGNLWVGLQYFGVSMFNGTSWVNYNVGNSGLANNYVKAFCAEPNGVVWIGTDNGLNKFVNGNWTVYNTSNSGIPGNNIRSICPDAQGNKWIATDNGLAKFNGTIWTVYNKSNSGIVANNVFSVVVEQNNVVWAGAHNTQTWPYYGGVSRFNGTSWTSFTPDNSPLPHLQVEALALDRLGNLWISPMSMGIAVYHEGGIVTAADDEELFSGTPKSFALFQNYPNPFNPSTTIRFSLSQPGHASLKVYDIMGRIVANLMEGRKDAGEYSIVFDGGGLTSGVYFYRLQTDRSAETKKMLLVK